MALKKLEHVTINCADLAKSRRFYSEVLGFTDGDRPPFAFPGAWLYAGEQAVVHLVGGRATESTNTGRFDHVAFEADDIAAVRARLSAAGVAFKEAGVPGRPLRQIFVFDPDGVRIELNFRGIQNP